MRLFVFLFLLTFSVFGSGWNSGMFLIRDEYGGGSGFLVELENEKYVVTNAHVFLSGENLKIQSVNGNEIKIGKIYTSNSKDLVLLQIKSGLPEDAVALKIHPNPESIPPNAKIIAYGNSLNGGVIVPVPGTICGIGPDAVEIDAVIVPGNSGGPVVLKQNRQVIGVSSYGVLSGVPGDWTLAGTRYLKEGIVRRFALRIDRLRLTDFTELTEKDVRTDLRSYSKVQKFFDGLPERKTKNVYRDYCLKNADLLTDADSHVWKTDFLKKRYEDKRQILSRLFNLLELGNIVLARNLNKIWNENAHLLKVRTVPPPKVKCPNCDISGQVRKPDESSDNGIQLRFGRKKSTTFSGFERKKLGTSAKEACPHCRGTGYFSKGVPLRFYDFPNSVAGKMRRCIQSDEVPFNSFTMGAPFLEEIRKQDYYNPETKTGSIRNPLGFTYRFRRNHAMPGAVETRFYEMFGRILRIEFYLKNTGGESRLRLKRYVEEHFSKTKRYQCLIGFANKNPVLAKLSGLDPFYIYAPEENPERAGYMHVTAVHETYFILNRLNFDAKTKPPEDLNF